MSASIFVALQPRAFQSSQSNHNPYPYPKTSAIYPTRSSIQLNESMCVSDNIKVHPRVVAFCPRYTQTQIRGQAPVQLLVRAIVFFLMVLRPELHIPSLLPHRDSDRQMPGGLGMYCSSLALNPLSRAQHKPSRHITSVSFAKSPITLA